MLTGVIQFYSPLKGCGYIQPDDGSARVFMSSADIRRAGLTSVHVGKRVRFTLAAPEQAGDAGPDIRRPPQAALSC